MLRVLSGMLMIALVAPALRADDATKAAEELKKIEEELKEAAAAFQKELREAKPEDRVELMKKNPAPKFFNRLYEFAEKNGKDPSAVDALNLCLRTAGQGARGASDNFVKTLNLLEKEHLKSESLAKTVRLLSTSSDEHVIKFLKTVLEKSPSKTVQARTCQTLAAVYEQMTRMGERLQKDENFRAQYEKALGKERVDSILKLAEEGKKEGETLAKLLKEKYSDIVPDLSVGKKAPEVISKDLDGKEVKLSDLRGKVVVLDIWATWCGPCVAMIPHEREMVKKMEGKPFVLVSISADEKKETLTAFLKKMEMPWTHWWNGRSGGILEDWNVRFFPTIYVLDAKGVIRHIGLRGEKLEEAVKELVKEAEAK